MAEAPPSRPDSGASTPNPRFTAKALDAEDVLKEQTVGLVQLSDFRKRRAEALQGGEDGTPSASGASTPVTDGREGTPKAGSSKKRKKAVKKGGLSFGDEEDGEEDWASVGATPAMTPGTMTPAMNDTDNEAASDTGEAARKKRLRPNASVGFAAKAMTKNALQKEAQLKDQLKREYVQMQEAVKATEFALSFVFFNGKDSPGGVVRMKKGDPIWLFLERARKVGADLAAKGDMSKRDWARIGVDDLMLVRQDLMIPHHYDFHHFIINSTVGYTGPLFSLSSEPTASTPANLLQSKESTPASASEAPTAATAEADPSSNLTTASDRKSKKEEVMASTLPDEELEGFGDDPAVTKVVDRRWYEKNKHIYPASIWEDFDPERDYSQGGRKDGQGNAFFYSK